MKNLFYIAIIIMLFSCDEFQEDVINIQQLEIGQEECATLETNISDSFFGIDIFPTIIACQTCCTKDICNSSCTKDDVLIVGSRCEINIQSLMEFEKSCCEIVFPKFSTCDFDEISLGNNVIFELCCTKQSCNISLDNEPEICLPLPF